MVNNSWIIQSNRAKNATKNSDTEITVHESRRFSAQVGQVTFFISVPTRPKNLNNRILNPPTAFHDEVCVDHKIYKIS